MRMKWKEMKLKGMRIRLTCNFLFVGTHIGTKKDVVDFVWVTSLRILSCCPASPLVGCLPWYLLLWPFTLYIVHVIIAFFLEILSVVTNFSNSSAYNFLNFAIFLFFGFGFTGDKKTTFLLIDHISYQFIGLIQLL